MHRRRIIAFSMALFLVVFAAIWLFINYSKSNVEYYHLFENQRELFQAVKDEIGYIEKSKSGHQSNTWDNPLYDAPNQFHDEAGPSLRDKIKQIFELSGGELSKLRYDKSNGEILIIFTFDWERVDGDTYEIVYSKSRDGVESYYSDKNVQYDLIELDENWYGTRIR
jgi:hypothetical protein